MHPICPSLRNFATAIAISCLALPAQAAIFGPAGVIPAFVPPSVGAQEQPTAAVTADFNNDGIPDLAVVNYHTSLLVIYLTDFIGFVHPAHEYNIFGVVHPVGVVAGDLDGDGNVDLVIGDQGTYNEDAQLTMLVGAGDGTFSPAATVHPGLPPLSEFSPLALRDLNGDGRVDLLFRGIESSVYHLLVLLNTGGSNFFGGFDYPLDDNSLGQFAVADFDGDGHSDAVFRGSGDAILFAKGNPDGTFNDPVTTGSGALLLNRAFGGDVDGDSKADFVFETHNGAYWARGNGDGSFQPPVVLGTFPGAFSANPGLAVADFNHDGRRDVAAAGTLFVQLPNHTFSLIEQFGWGTSTEVLASADFNQDLRSDVVTIGPDPDHIAIFETVAGPATHALLTGGNHQSTAANTLFAHPLALRVLDASNNGVPNLDVHYNPPGGFGASALLNPGTTSTQPTGVATSLATANNTIGCYDVTATIQTLPDTLVYNLCNIGPDHMIILGGDPQSTLINTNFAQSLSVEVLDGANNPKANVKVSFSAPPTLFQPSAFLSTTSFTTNASGIAIVNISANGWAGSYVVTASAAGLPPASFHLTNTAPPGAAAKIILDPLTSPQSALINTAFSQPLKVRVVDGGNNPIQGATVTFAPLTAFPSGASATVSAATDVTDASGTAQAVVATANGIVGSYSVRVAVQNNNTVPAASIGLRNVAPLPAAMALVGGTPQSTPINAAFGQPLQVVLTDSLGNPAPQVMVFFIAPATGAGALLSQTAVLSDTNGVARVTAIANGTAGSYPVVAVVFQTTGEQPILVPFDLTNTDLAVAQVPALSGLGLVLLAAAVVGAALALLRRAG